MEVKVTDKPLWGEDWNVARWELGESDILMETGTARLR